MTQPYELQPVASAEAARIWTLLHDPPGVRELSSAATASHGVQVQQWLAFVHTQLTPLMDDSLAEVNTWLATRTFLVGTTATLADLVLYAALSPAIVRPACGPLLISCVS